MRFSTLASGLATALTLSTASATAVSSTKFSATTQDYFDFAMQLGDSRFDPVSGFMWYIENGLQSDRFTAWYIPGLLYRNKGNDLKDAKQAIKAVLSSQMNGQFDSAWYGTYRISPDEPIPTGEDGLYPAAIYDTYDPNWRAFIGATLVQVVAEFEHLLDAQTIKDIETSLAYAAVGEMRRNGSYPTGDNLIVGYTNPQTMGILMIGWIGERLNNSTFINYANKLGTEVYELFIANGSNTFTEYNVPTYYGVDTFGLAANIKYGPKNAALTKNAPFLLSSLWADIAEHYNSYLGNMAGPYDRAYARDMPTHSAIIGQYWWGLFGYDKAPLPYKGNDDLRYDMAQAPSLALIMSTVKSTLSADTLAKMIAPFSGERMIKKTIREDLNTDVLRYADSWISKHVMIGGETLAETKNRGAQFTPAIVHWASDNINKPFNRFPFGSFFQLRATASTIKTEVSASSLSISYPNATQAGTDLFTYMISGIPPAWNLAGNVIDGFSNLPCLKVAVDAPGLEIQPTNYYGNTISNQFYYNVTYVVPENFTGTPKMTLNLTYTC